eukprot:362016-Chlamydomonas_euryale.AAC.1
MGTWRRCSECGVGGRGGKYGRKSVWEMSDALLRHALKSRDVEAVQCECGACMYKYGGESSGNRAYGNGGRKWGAQEEEDGWQGRLERRIGRGGGEGGDWEAGSLHRSLLAGSQMASKPRGRELSCRLATPQRPAAHCAGRDARLS